LSILPLAFETQVWIIVAASVVSLIAFIGLILVPALGSFGRLWEKAAATFLSLFVLVTLIMIGIAIGLVLVIELPDQISNLFS
jgi:hypothetical protein